MSPAFRFPEWLFLSLPEPRNRAERRRNDALVRRHTRQVRRFFDRVLARAIVRWGKVLRERYFDPHFVWTPSPPKRPDWELAEDAEAAALA